MRTIQSVASVKESFKKLSPNGRSKVRRYYRNLRIRGFSRMSAKELAAQAAFGAEMVASGYWA